MWRKLIVRGLVLLAAALVLIQLIPVGNFVKSLRRDANPPVVTAVEWDSAETERLARTACYDCHSNETVWPWYAQVAPVSWLVTRDVNKGREAMNFSEDPLDDYDADDLEWHVMNDMPPRLYLPLHPEANLSAEQKTQFIAGLRATFGSDGMSGMDMDDD